MLVFAYSSHYVGESNTLLSHIKVTHLGVIIKKKVNINDKNDIL